MELQCNLLNKEYIFNFIEKKFGIWGLNRIGYLIFQKGYLM
jgi:hypothetical protein